MHSYNVDNYMFESYNIEPAMAVDNIFYRKLHDTSKYPYYVYCRIFPSNKTKDLLLLLTLEFITYKLIKLQLVTFCQTF